MVTLCRASSDISTFHRFVALCRSVESGRRQVFMPCTVQKHKHARTCVKLWWVCHDHAGADDELWYKLAAQKWPLQTLRLLPHYQTYKELLMYDNDASAWPVVDLAAAGKCSTWKYNRPSRFYQCRLISLQLDRLSRNIRLCFDARGEAELPPPWRSYVAMIEDRPEHDYNCLPDGGMQPDESALLRTAASDEWDNITVEPGHFKGTLVWALKNLLPTSSAQQVNAFDASLVFCYANTVVLAPIQEFEAEYRTVELLKIPAGISFEQAMEQQCTKFELPHEPEHRLRSQSLDDERALWHSLPPAIKKRRDRQWGFISNDN